MNAGGERCGQINQPEHRQKGAESLGGNFFRDGQLGERPQRSAMETFASFGELLAAVRSVELIACRRGRRWTGRARR